MFHLKNYIPHEGQLAFHWAMDHYRFIAMIAGIRGGKTFAGAREATRQAWNAKGKGVYGIIAPTFNMLDRTTWMEFKEAARPLIASENDSKKIIVLKNGRRIHGHSAERPDRIRNETFVGFWGDEMREAKNFRQLWDVLLGRVLSTNGKGFITTSPNSYDDIHDIFIATKREGYGVVRFPTYANVTLSKEGIDQLAGMYDSKYAQQEIQGEFVIFEGAVYYTFNRQHNAGDLAFKVAQYDPTKPICLAADFNIDPMAWVICQYRTNENGLKQIVVIDEIFMRNTNTAQACEEFKSRYPNHTAGVVLYGDATGQARHTDSNRSNWKIIEEELSAYGITKRVPTSNPAERDRVNAVNRMICNSKGERNIFVNPNCKHTIQDLEQVAFKEGSTKIDKDSNLLLTHPSDALGYLIERDFSLNKGSITGLKI
jgi:phage terminase large subunit